MSTTKELYLAAQLLIRSGQPVFPCHPRGEKAKRPLTKNGFLDATTDVPTVKRWLQRHEGAALGIPTGIKYDVLDVDIKENADGRVHIYRLQQLGLLNGCKKIIRTPSGGMHLYFLSAPGLTNKARGATLGLDVRASGGYVLAAPSYIETPDYSGHYVDEGETIGGTDEPLWWDLIVSALRPVNTKTNEPVTLLPSERRAGIASLREFVLTLQEGERNNGFHWAVCRCIEANIDPNELFEVAAHIGLGEEEISLTINSALRRAGVAVEDLDSEGESLFPGE